MISITFKADKLDKTIGVQIEQELEALQDTYQIEVRKRTPIDQGRARRGWQKRTQGSNRQVRNEVPYIERLEGGYSKQAPRGFVNQALKATINQRNRKK